MRIVSGGGMNLMNFDIRLGGDGGADYGEDASGLRLNLMISK